MNTFMKIQGSSAARTALQMIALVGATLASSIVTYAADAAFDYRMLATTKTSTMEKELNEAAGAGFRISRVMGGKVTNGGQVIVAMVKAPVAAGQANHNYRLLATSKTSTMEQEMQQLAAKGYSYIDQAVFDSALGGKEVAVIMEMDPNKANSRPASYRLLATTRATTMQTEMQDAGAQGYALVGFTVGKTGAGGSQIIAILKKD